MLLLPLSLAGLALSVWAPGGLSLAVPSWLLSAPLWGGVLLLLLLRCLYHPSVPAVRIALEPSEACDMPPRMAPPSAKELADPVRKQSTVDCWDPATGHYLGAERVCSPGEVKERVRRARAAQQEWAKSSFDQRRQLLRILSRCTLEHADAIVSDCFWYIICKVCNPGAVGTKQKEDFEYHCEFLLDRIAANFVSFTLIEDKRFTEDSKK